MEYRFFDALSLLLTVVVEQTEGVLAEQNDGNEVAGSEEGHNQVGDVPNELEAGQGAKYHHEAA